VGESFVPFSSIGVASLVMVLFEAFEIEQDGLA
jgi:hypothetical protein